MNHGREDYNDRIQDSLSLIPVDEPVLLIRGQDHFAAEVASYYAWLTAHHDEKRAEELRKHANKMRIWPKKKFADVPFTGVRDNTIINTTSSGIDVTKEESKRMYSPLGCSFDGC